MALVQVIPILLYYEIAATHKGKIIDDPKEPAGIINIRNEVLRRHNFYREIHSVPALNIDSELNKFSQDWSNKLAKTDTMEHRPDNKFGENLYMIKSIKKVLQVGIKAVDGWYSEKQFFNYHGTEEEMIASLDKAGHLTQLLWKGSKKLGVGVSYGDSGKTYVVCNYDPPGNFESIIKENVLPPKTGDA